MDDSDDPIRADELDALFAPLVPHMASVLAVSGGSDSTALMLLFADWLRRRGQDTAQHTVLTVDHGLRADSAAEAGLVAVAAARLGYRHATLAWEGSKPQTGIQAAARRARYRLLGDYMRVHGISLLLTAHTRDDQAETLIMRLARGSGLDGLSAMAPVAPLGDCGQGETEAAADGVIARPLLDVPKARLRATLKARGIAWIEDPSNRAPEFERPRLRAARPALHALGLTDAMLALSAARLLRARRALERIAEGLCDPRGGIVDADPCGYFTIDRPRLRDAGEEIALRVVGRAIAGAGGAGRPVPLGKLETIVTALCAGAQRGSWALARALITASETSIVIEREPGREALPRLTLVPGRTLLWDRRYWVSIAANFPEGPVEVRALGGKALAELRRAGAVASAAAPARALRLLPSFWQGDTLLAVPPLQYWAKPDYHRDLCARFVGIGKFDPSWRWPDGADPPEFP